ncbi:hypothetical protein [Aliarcobacter butzleri]|uniref:hypothetical protein n=1 Tax=Aliarcobacter butzleri TaxID=28197 RepID=UPI00263C6F0F|nr:hypothetical protein [Aliarcobacter butzleri]MDN5128802.1 hypothetical protein [Aliarcobacter butzleri]
MIKITKELLEKKVNEMIQKDKRFINKNVKINFDSEKLEKGINKSIDSLEKTIKKNNG